MLLSTGRESVSLRRPVPLPPQKLPVFNQYLFFMLPITGKLLCKELCFLPVSLTVGCISSKLVIKVLGLIVFRVHPGPLYPLSLNCYAGPAILYNFLRQA